MVHCGLGSQGACMSVVNSMCTLFFVVCSGDSGKTFDQSAFVSSSSLRSVRCVRAVRRHTKTASGLFSLNMRLQGSTFKKNKTMMFYCSYVKLPNTLVHLVSVSHIVIVLTLFCEYVLRQVLQSVRTKSDQNEVRTRWNFAALDKQCCSILWRDTARPDKCFYFLYSWGF